MRIKNRHLTGTHIWGIHSVVIYEQWSARLVLSTGDLNAVSLFSLPLGNNFFYQHRVVSAREPVGN